MKLRVAILDLYEGFENQGMRCLKNIIAEYAMNQSLLIDLEVFDVRLENKLPDLSFDIYISSGGPGSPLESEGLDWDTAYINWITAIEDWNANNDNAVKKSVFLICHSFQLYCRHYKIGNLCKRKSTSFGVFPVHLIESDDKELVFEGLKDPFYVVDSRDYQLIEPDHAKLEKLGAKILCIEKNRPHVPYERAVMAIRFSETVIGTQFHPEADAVGMRLHLQTENRKKVVIENHGETKWKDMIDHLHDPDKILWTYSHVLPNFLTKTINRIQSVMTI
jgi:homoserine O-succinyltransferase/O-acetyltransferase